MKAAVLDRKSPRPGMHGLLPLSDRPRAERVREKKVSGGASNRFSAERPRYPADGFLVKVAGIGPWSTKIIDAYTRVFRPFSTVRKKLILLLAILESCAPTHAYLDSVDSGSIPLVVPTICSIDA